MNHRTKTMRAAFALLFTSAFLYGCGSGSGAPVASNPVTTTTTPSTYSGPPPATPDVQSFKLNVWDNLIGNCGQCHDASQNPRFVRSDDINLAYDAANTVVNLNDPGLSLMVTKVRGGHNCWLDDDDACGDSIQNNIERWAADTLGGVAKSIQLVAADIKDPGQSKNFPPDSSLFASSVHPLLVQYCSQCHSDEAAVPQSPFFASADPDTAYAAAQSRIDLETPSQLAFCRAAAR